MSKESEAANSWKTRENRKENQMKERNECNMLILNLQTLRQG